MGNNEKMHASCKSAACVQDFHKYTTTHAATKQEGRRSAHKPGKPPRSFSIQWPCYAAGVRLESKEIIIKSPIPIPAQGLHLGLLKKWV